VPEMMKSMRGHSGGLWKRTTFDVHCKNSRWWRRCDVLRQCSTAAK